MQLKRWSVSVGTQDHAGCQSRMEDSLQLLFVVLCENIDCYRRHHPSRVSNNPRAPCPRRRILPSPPKMQVRPASIERLCREQLISGLATAFTAFLAALKTDEGGEAR